LPKPATFTSVSRSPPPPELFKVESTPNGRFRFYFSTYFLKSGFLSSTENLWFIPDSITPLTRPPSSISSSSAPCMSRRPKPPHSDLSVSLLPPSPLQKTRLLVLSKPNEPSNPTEFVPPCLLSLCGSRLQCFLLPVPPLRGASPLLFKNFHQAPLYSLLFDFTLNIGGWCNMTSTESLISFLIFFRDDPLRFLTPFGYTHSEISSLGNAYEFLFLLPL